MRLHFASLICRVSPFADNRFTQMSPPRQRNQSQREMGGHAFLTLRIPRHKGDLQPADENTALQLMDSAATRAIQPAPRREATEASIKVRRLGFKLRSLCGNTSLPVRLPSRSPPAARRCGQPAPSLSAVERPYTYTGIFFFVFYIGRVGNFAVY